MVSPLCATSFLAVRCLAAGIVEPSGMVVARPEAFPLVGPPAQPLLPRGGLGGILGECDGLSTWLVLLPFALVTSAREVSDFLPVALLTLTWTL